MIYDVPEAERITLPKAEGTKRVRVYLDGFPILFATVDLNPASLVQVSLTDD